jgi:hypothetical protein
MVAAILYVLGLMSTVISIIVIAAQSPELMDTFSAAMEAGSTNMVGVVVEMLVDLNRPLTMLLAGLLLMGFARIIMLLGSINRSLRGSV